MLCNYHFAGYTRISVDEELDRDNVSIENQKAIIEDFVKARFLEALWISSRIEIVLDIPSSSGRGIRRCAEG